MNTKNPRVTVQNTDGPDWLVTCEGLVSASGGMESITFTVAIPRSAASLEDVTRQAAQRAASLLRLYLEQT